MTQSNHTPTPMSAAAAWVKEEMQDYFAACSFLQKDPEKLPYYQPMKDAERACSAHDDLVKGLKESNDVLKAAHIHSPDAALRRSIGEIIVSNDAALAKARGEA